MEEREVTDVQQWLIKHRIACPEAGYPVSEARFATEQDYWKWFLS